MRKKFLTTAASIAFLVLVCGTKSIYACSCGGPKPPCQATWEADAVFVGTVLSTEEKQGRGGFDSRLIKLSVEESFRGIASNVVEVFTGSGGGDCGFSVEVGQQYLVYAYKGETGRLATSICTRTRALIQASEDLEFLRGLSRAAPGSTIQGEVHRVKYNSDGNVSDLPLPGIRVILEGDFGYANTTTDEKGKFAVGELSPGTYKVSLELPKGLSAGLETQQVKVSDKGCAVVYFRVESDGRLSGRVVNVLQSPIAKAEIYILTAGKRKYEAYTQAAYSKDDGFYELSRIPAGTYVLQIRFDGQTGSTRPFPLMFYPGVSDQSQATVIEIGEGQRIENYNLTMPDLPKDRIVEGTVLASDGRLVSDATVLYRTDPKMINTVPMVGPGHFRLRVYEGVKIALQAWLEIGNGKYPVSDWLEIPATGDATRIKLVAPSHRIPK